MVEESEGTHPTRMSTSRRSLFSPTNGADARKISFSPSSASRNTAFLMKHNVQNDTDVVQLQMELADLRKRVKILDGDTGRNELLDLLKEREEENKRTEHQLRSLNDKFQHVHKGLIQIDEERQKLSQAKNQLEKEKADIQRQLDIREKEVMSLARRCSSQEQKMKESSKLRASNSELTSKMEGLQTDLTLREEEIAQIESLKAKLKECQASKEELLGRLAKLKKDHESVAETLNTCFQNMQKMTESKAEVEEERKREMQQAQLGLHKQKLAYLESTNELRAELQLKQDRIEQMEKILQDNMGTCTSLRKEKAEWNRTMQQEIFKLKETQATERTALQLEHEQIVQKLHEEYAEMLDGVRTKMDEKDRMVSSLEDEVGQCMQKMMALSSELQILQEDKKEEKSSHCEAMQKLESEKCALEDLLRSRDQDIAELSESIAALEKEKGLLSTEMLELQQRLKDLEEENAFIMELEGQLQDVNTSIVEVEEQRCLAEEEYGMTVALLSQELDDERQMWVSMEQGLLEKISALEEEKRSAQKESERALIEARTVLGTLEDASINTTKALFVSLEVLNQERAIRADKEEELASLREVLAESQADARNEKDRSDLLTAELVESRETLKRTTLTSEERISALMAESKNVCEVHEREAASVRQAIEFKDQALYSVQEELRELRESNKQEVTSLQERLAKEQTEVSTLRSKLSEARISLGADAAASQRILMEKDTTIFSLKKEVSSFKEMVKDREQVISETKARLEKELVLVREDLEASHNAMLQDELEHAREMRAKDDALAAMKEKLEELRIAAERESAETHELLSEQACLVSSLKSELTEVRTAAEKDAAERSQAAVAKDTVISSLKADLDSLKLSMEEQQSAAQESLVIREEELNSIKGQFEESQDAAEKMMKLLKDKLDQKDAALSSLEIELEELRSTSTETSATFRLELESKNSALASLEQQLIEAREAGQSEIACIQMTSATKDRTIATLREEYTESRKAFERKATDDAEALAASEVALLSVKKELERVREDLDHARNFSDDTMTQKDELIRSLRSDLEDARSKTASTVLMQNETVKAKEEMIVSLQTELGRMRLALAGELAAIKKELTEKSEAFDSLNTELEDIKRARENDLALHETRNASKDELCSTLKNELEELRVRSDNNAKGFREQVARLKIELQKTATNLAIKEDEFRDLKLIELKDAEEMIASLESQVVDMRQSSTRREGEVIEALSNLQSQLTQQTTMKNHLERKLANVSQQHKGAVESLNEEIAALQKERRTLEDDLKNQSATLQERHATISVLTRKNTLLEQRERTLQSQLDSAALDLKRAKAEQERALNALDREINRQRSNREDDDIHFQKRCATLQKELADAEAKLFAQEREMAEVQKVLEERTQLLGDMVAHNKETEDEKDQAIAHVSDLQEAVDRYQEDIEAVQGELSDLREMQQKREEQLLDTIHNERQLREIAEADLEATKSRFRSVRRDSKDVNELEKENMALKDKVRRQEDYLKRKLQKEKVLRERKTKNVLATPARITSPSKRRQVPASVGASSTMSFALSETSSFPDEWEDHSSY